MPSPRTSDFEREMQQLEAELKRLEVEYTMFFAGRLPRLPWETRARVEARVKRWDRAGLRNTAERFRFGSLQARFAAFCELWERNLRAREEGRPVAGTRRGAAAAAAEEALAPAPEPRRPRDGVVHVASFRDVQHEPERVQELYQRLSEARRQAGEPPVAYDRFVEVVRTHARTLGSTSGEIAFRVAVKDGKVTLTARALTPPKSGGGSD